AFSSCTGLTSVTIPNSVTKISSYTFEGCVALTDLTFEDGENVLTLSSNGSSPLFVDCPLDEVYIGRKLAYTTTADAGYSPFYGNTSLRTVEITDAETQIYDNEFNGCSNLQSVQIGDGVTKIGKWAFSGCSALEYFLVGSNVERISPNAFSDCTSLISFTSNAAVPPICGPQALDGIDKWECTLYVPAESIEQYKVADQWKDFFFIEESGIEDVSVDADSMDAPVEYFNLQGIRVENPTSGIYIRRQGSSITKVTIK
ncbi:MAG: leucine-rich repeat domain-containing protein, partial [Muribaculaceae bacterium]